MKISTLLVSIMVFVGAFAAMGGIYSDLQNTYNPTNSTTAFEDFSDATTDMTESMSALENHSIGVVKDPTKFGEASLIFLDLGGIIYNSLRGFFNFIVALPEAFGLPIPSWFTMMIIGSVSLIVLFQIITLFMRSYQPI